MIDNPDSLLIAMDICRTTL